MTTISAIYQQ